MDLKELNSWVETDEGKQWLEGQKKPLLDKRDELLEKVKAGNASIEQLTQRVASLESDLSKSQAVNNSVLLEKPLMEKLQNKGVFPVLIPSLVKSLSKTYGLCIQDGNAVTGKVKEGDTKKALNIDQIIEHWSKSDSAKDCFRPQELQTQSTSPDFKTDQKAIDKTWAAMRKGAGLSEKE
jgi:hypothetical protein